MQARHQPDIKYIKPIPGSGNRHRPPRRSPGEKFPVLDREYPAISQMNLKRYEWLGIVVFPQCFDCHAVSYSIANRSLQSVAVASRPGLLGSAASP